MQTEIQGEVSRQRGSPSTSPETSDGLTTLAVPASTEELSKFRRAHAYTIPREESVSFAYLLGALAARTERGIALNRLAFTSYEHREVELAVRAVTDTFNTEPEILLRNVNGVSVWTAIFSSSLVAQHISTVSANNSRIPWEHIGTTAEKRAFLQALFDGMGSVAVGIGSDGIILRKDNSRELFREVAKLLYGFGIMGRLSTEGSLEPTEPSCAVFRLMDPDEWRRFDQEVGFRVESKVTLLAKLTAIQRVRPSATADAYDRVMERYAAHGWGALSRLDDLGVTTSQAKRWISRAGQPRSVTRRNELLAQIEGSTDGDIICAHFRAAHSSEDARGRAIQRSDYLPS